MRTKLMTRLGTLAALVMVSSGLNVSQAAATAAENVSVQWSKVTGASLATPTLQVVVNPLLRPPSPVARRALLAVQRLKADYVRFVPWLPYPQLAVAELYPPSQGKTFWNFKLIDPMVRAFMHASDDRPVIMNFSTIPEWMFKTKKPVTWPKNPDQVTWNYEQGTQLRDASLKTLAGYYARLVSWYTRGGLRDEYGHWHASGYHYKFAWWEVLNEVNFEHHMNVQEYTRWYDAITKAIHKVSPDTKFVGMAMAMGQSAGYLPWYKYFLNLSNHAPGTPLDMISFHFYASPPANAAPSQWPNIFFSQAQQFLTVASKIAQYRKEESPNTLLNVDELGSILPYDTAPKLVRPIPHMYWNLTGAMYAYLYVRLAQQGVNVVGESQLIGYPSQFPSVSMIHWTTGAPNARFRVLELLVRNCGPGDKMVHTNVAIVAHNGRKASQLFAQAFVTPAGAKRVLLVNMGDSPSRVSIAGAAGAQEMWVDQITGSKQPGARTLPHDAFSIGGLGVAVIKLK
ncbi:MAG: GH39 family glycosyl hydrolase [Phycisphaerae bacterium]